MKQKEINDYNRRCAEFLGVTLHESQITTPHSHFMRYHSDWNYIMEVVEAIERLGFYTKILDNGMTIEGKLVLERWGKNKKEGVVQAINQFLIYYNNENSNNRQP